MAETSKALSVGTPAQVFHVAEFIADACMERGWSLWDFAERTGALDTPVTVLAWELYASCATVCDPHCIMGEDDPADLERVLGISAEFWQHAQALYRATPADRRAPLSFEAFEFYDLGARADYDDAFTRALPQEGRE